jgi:hypothetical protein
MEKEVDWGNFPEGNTSEEYVSELRGRRPKTMTLTKDSRFIVTDTRTGKKHFPKGVYWNGRNIIIIGDINDRHISRLHLLAENTIVEVRE